MLEINMYRIPVVNSFRTFFSTFKQRDVALHAISVNKAKHDDLYRTVFGLCDFLVGN